MTATPTPAEFLAASEPDEPDDEVLVILDPLASIAHSLSRITSVLTELAEEHRTVDAENGRADAWAAEAAQLEDSLGHRQQVIDGILAVCAKSKGQLAEKVRQVVDQAFAGPEVSEPVASEQPAEPGA